jgi:hypothetical protein
VDESLLKETKDWSVYNWERLFKELNVGDIIKWRDADYVKIRTNKKNRCETLGPILMALGNLTEQDIKDAITLMKIK